MKKLDCSLDRLCARETLAKNTIWRQCEKSVMKIGIVCGHYMPEVGYQEVSLARALARLGNEVRVFCSNKRSPSVRKVKSEDYAAGLLQGGQAGLSILRLKPAMSAGSWVLCSGLKVAIERFVPDIVIVIGVGKLFPYPALLQSNDRKYQLVTLFGDNADFWNWSTYRLALNSLKSVLLQKLLKSRLYARAVRASDRVFLYTPETESILTSYLSINDNIRLERKKASSTLGFDPTEFYFDEDDRNSVRRRLAISDDQVVLITATRVTRQKNLESVIARVVSLQEREKKVHYILVGFMGDAYERELKSFIEAQACPEVFHFYAFQSHAEIRKLYCAADIGIWFNAAISIQEAMGTGLPVMLQRKSVVSHLVQQGVSGWYFEREELGRVLKTAVQQVGKMGPSERETRRRELVALNSRQLSYDAIAERIITDSLIKS